MEKEIILSPTREKILRVVEDNFDISLGQISEKIGIPYSTAFCNVKIMEAQGLLKTQKVGKERRVRLKGKASAGKTKRSRLKLSLVELIYKFSLEELEVEILLKAKKGETPKEVAERLGALLMPVETRVVKSIPFKSGVATFEEAREKFRKMLSDEYRPEEDQFIIENCEKMNFEEIASHLGRSSSFSIHQRIQILERLGKVKRIGLGFVKNGVFHRPYSEEEDETIKKLYPSLGKKFLAKQLNRPEASIQYRASTKLKVKKAPPTYLNVYKVAKLLKVGQPRVRDWIYQGFLKASKSGRGAGSQQEWRIEPQDFYDFLRDYYYLYDPERVEDESLRLFIEKSTPAGIPIRQAVKVLGANRLTLRKQAREGKIPAYKGFGPRGHARWYIQLDRFAFNRSLTR